MPVTTNTWNVNTDGDWATAADWSLGTVPDSNNDVVINTLSIHTITHYNGADTVNSLTVGNDHFVLNGGSLALVAGASFGLDYQQFGGTLLGAGVVSIMGAGNLLGGGAQGTLAFQIGGTIQIGNYSLGGSDTLTNNATTNQTAALTLGDNTGVNAKISTLPRARIRSTAITASLRAPRRRVSSTPAACKRRRAAGRATSASASPTPGRSRSPTAICSSTGRPTASRARSAARGSSAWAAAAST